MREGGIHKAEGGRREIKGDTQREGEIGRGREGKT